MKTNNETEKMFYEIYEDTPPSLSNTNYRISGFRHGYTSIFYENTSRSSSNFRND